MAVGMTWGIGTVLMWFFNGVHSRAISGITCGTGRRSSGDGSCRNGSFEITRLLIAASGSLFTRTRSSSGRRHPKKLDERVREVP